MPQEPHLFIGTVRDNIAYGRPDATDAEVEAAARAVGALDAIAGLPGGFRHPIAERGRNLSAGQRQLISLARAELVDPDILLLDEATAALDPAAEAAVSAATDRLARGRTTIVVAHRLTTAARADRIVVMDHGRVVRGGTARRTADPGRRVRAALCRGGRDTGPSPPTDPDRNSSTRQRRHDVRRATSDGPDLPIPAAPDPRAGSSMTAARGTVCRPDVYWVVTRWIVGDATTTDRPRSTREV